MRNRPSWVYFARLVVGRLIPWEGRARDLTLIKIGMSIGPDTRVRELVKAYNVESAMMLACVPGGRQEEQAFHRQFQNSRLAPVYNNIPGELFYPTRDLMEFIEKISEEERKMA